MPKVLSTLKTFSTNPRELYESVTKKWTFSSAGNSKYSQVIPYCLITDGDDYVTFNVNATIDFGMLCYPTKTKFWERKTKQNLIKTFIGNIKERFLATFQELNIPISKIIISDTHRAVYRVDRSAVHPILGIVLPSDILVKFKPIEGVQVVILSKEHLVQLGMLNAGSTLLSRAVAYLMAMKEVDFGQNREITNV